MDGLGRPGLGPRRRAPRWSFCQWCRRRRWRRCHFAFFRCWWRQRWWQSFEHRHRALPRCSDGEISGRSGALLGAPAALDRERERERPGGGAIRQGRGRSVHLGFEDQGQRLELHRPRARWLALQAPCLQLWPHHHRAQAVAQRGRRSSCRRRHQVPCGRRAGCLPADRVGRMPV